jgi:hypothetical protein
MAHDFPLDTQSVEIKPMLGESKNNGHPFSKAELGKS